MVPEQELPVLEALVQIRNRLTKLKKDRTEFIRARDVLESYSALMVQVNKLNDIRAKDDSDTVAVENRVDTILNDVFQLLSLFFLTIGKARESPATYCQLATMKRLLTHLTESGIYTEADLRPFQSRLVELRSIILSSSPAPLTHPSTPLTHHLSRSSSSAATSPYLGGGGTTTESSSASASASSSVAPSSTTSPKVGEVDLTPVNELNVEGVGASLMRGHNKAGVLNRTLTNNDEDTVDGQVVGGGPSERHREEGGGEEDEEEEDPNDVSLRMFLLTRWDQCQALTNKLLSSLSSLSPQLAPLHQRLVTLRRLLTSIAARVRVSSSDVTPILAELRTIEDRKSASGKFQVLIPATTEDGEDELVTPEKGQQLCAGLLEDNFELCQEVLARDGSEKVGRGPLQHVYERLGELKAQLERLVLTHRWTLRETDLYNFQVTLREIDNMRVGGKFVDPEGQPVEGQLVLLYLLRRCYGLCYRLMASSEPISEELMPVANKLTTIKRCLAEVQKHGGPYSPMDIYPYQLALSQIDALRTDGRFEGRDGSVPEGQGILNALMSEAFEMVSVMQEESALLEGEGGGTANEDGDEEMGETAPTSAGEEEKEGLAAESKNGEEEEERKAEVKQGFAGQEQGKAVVDEVPIAVEGGAKHDSTVEVLARGVEEKVVL